MDISHADSEDTFKVLVGLAGYFCVRNCLKAKHTIIKLHGPIQVGHCHVYTVRPPKPLGGRRLGRGDQACKKQETDRPQASEENPAVVQAIMRHAKMDMTLYYSHSSARRSVRRKKKCSTISSQKECGCRSGYRKRLSETEADQELVYNDELTARTWALNSAVECHLHTVEVIGSNPIAPTI